MNERIKELIFEAVKFYLDPDSNTHQAQVSPEDLEYFAELIVQECAKIADKAEPYKASDLIKGHFGVEE